MFRQGAAYFIYMSNTEVRAGQTILDEPIQFKIKSGWFKRLFGIKFESYKVYPLKYGTLLYISKIASELPDVNNEKTLLALAMENPATYKQIVKAVAYAILNDKKRIIIEHERLCRKLIWRLNAKEVFYLFSMITAQMDVESFFFTINLIKGKNLLTKKSTEAAKPFGVQSEQQ